MLDRKTIQSLINLEKALGRLGEALNEDASEELRTEIRKNGKALYSAESGSVVMKSHHLFSILTG